MAGVGLGEPGLGIEQRAAHGARHEVTHHGQGAARTLAPLVALERDARIVEACPGTGHDLRVHEDEPAVGIALGGAGLAGHIGANAVLLANRAARALVDHGAHHLQQTVVFFLVPDLIGFGRGEFGQQLAVGILDTGDQLGRNVVAGVGNAAVGVDHLQQRDGAGAQRQRRHGLQRALAHAQAAGQLDDAVHAHFLAQLGRDGVLGIGQRIAELHGHARGLDGIAGTPYLAAGQLDFHGFVLARVVGPGAALQGCAIDKGLEGGAGLAARLGHMVERILGIVAAAHPGQHGRAARVYGQKAGLHAGLVLAQLPHEGLVGQQLLERLFLADVGRPAASGKPAKGLRLAHQLQHQRVLGAPAVAVAPVVVGNALQRLHLAVHGLLRPVLQARVQRGADDQAVRIDVVVVFVGPGDQPFAQLLGKMRRHARGFLLTLEVQTHGAFPEALELIVLELAALDHLAQHGVAPGNRAVGVDHRVVIGIALEHAHQRGAFQHREPGGRFVEIGARGHLYAIGVVEKGHGVQIGLENLVLGVERFDLEGRDRLLELAVHIAGAADFRGIEIARQLLGDGGAALGIAAKGVDDRPHGAREVHAVVLVETMVFGGHEGLDHGGRNLLQRHPLAVAALELADQLAVGAQDLRGLLELGLADVADAGRERNQQQHIDDKQHRQGRGKPQPFTPRRPATPPGQGCNALAQSAGASAHPQSCGLSYPFFFQFVQGQTHVARQPAKGRKKARLRRMPKKQALCLRGSVFLWSQPRYCLRGVAAQACFQW